MLSEGRDGVDERPPLGVTPEARVRSFALRTAGVTLGFVLAGAGLTALVVRVQSAALTVFERLGLLGIGLVLGWAMGGLIAYMFHAPVTRRLIIPWGTTGGFGVLLFGVLSASGEARLVRFIAIALASPLAVTCGLRLIIDGVRGPLSDRPYWADPVDPSAEELDPALAVPLSPAPPRRHSGPLRLDKSGTGLRSEPTRRLTPTEGKSAVGDKP
jgi:hypothetical protein